MKRKAERMIRVLGKKQIIQELGNGATLTRVSGKYGGWAIGGLNYLATVRKDSCYALLCEGKLACVERTTGKQVYKLK